MSSNLSFTVLDNSFESSFQNLNRLILVGDIDAASQLAQQLAVLNSKDFEDDSPNELVSKEFLPYNPILYVPFIYLFKICQ